MRKIKIGDFVECKNGTIGRVMEINKNGVRLRKVSKCVGRYSLIRRIGKPYTYQIIIKPKQLNKVNIISIDTILKMLITNKWGNY